MSKCRNFSSSLVLATAPQAPDTEFTVLHELSRAPLAGFVVRATKSARLYRPIDHPDLSSIIGMWEFENSGALGEDSHTNNLDLTNNGAVQAAGKVGFSADFERDESDNMSRASESLLQTGDIDFTFAAWLQLESKPAAGFQMAVAKVGLANTTWEYYLGYGTAIDRFQFAVFRPAGVTVNADALGSPSLATWYFVVAWHNAALDTINIQVNNGTVNTTATGGALQAPSTADFRLGMWARTDQPPHHWDGLIDQMMFWKRVLNADERAWLYNSGVGRTYADVVGPETVKAWTNDEAFLKCDTPNAAFYILFIT